MTNAFDPKQFLIKLPKRVKDAESGKWTTVLQDYLEVRYRVQHFREQFPHGHILTEEICVDVERGYARYKAIVNDGEGGSASAYGTEVKASFEDYVEKASTRAVGRALALMGFGTPFSGEDLDESSHVADAPVITSTNGHLPVAPGVVEAPAPPPVVHPTAEDIERLGAIALAAKEDKEVFGDRLRRLLHLGAEVKLTKKLLRETMTVEQYSEVMTYYENLMRQILRPNVSTPEVSDGAPLAPAQAPTSEPAATEEGAPAVPPSPSSAPAVAASASASPETDPAYHQLYQEALGWGVNPGEVEHILTHHRDLAKCRTMLWKARRNEPPPVWEKVPAAAD